MARYRKYRTGKHLEMVISRYFTSISRTITAKEEFHTGRYTEKGVPIYELRPILNDKGEEIKSLQYVVPPSISALCLYLGISKQTWTDYCDGETHPEFLDSTMRARARVESYLEEQLTQRQKGVQGIIFNLQNNYGWREKKEVELGEATRKSVAGAGMSLEEKLALLEEAARDFNTAGMQHESDGDE